MLNFKHVALIVATETPLLRFFMVKSGQVSPSTDRVIREMRDDSADSPPAVSVGAHCRQFWHGQRHPLFDIIHLAFPMLTTVSPTLKGALEDGHGLNSLSKLQS